MTHAFQNFLYFSQKKNAAGRSVCYRFQRRRCYLGEINVWILLLVELAHNRTALQRPKKMLLLVVVMVNSGTCKRGKSMSRHAFFQCTGYKLAYCLLWRHRALIAPPQHRHPLYTHVRGTHLVSSLLPGHILVVNQLYAFHRSLWRLSSLNEAKKENEAWVDMRSRMWLACGAQKRGQRSRRTNDWQST